MNGCIPESVYLDHGDDDAPDGREILDDIARKAADQVAEFESQQVKDLLASEDIQDVGSAQELRGRGYVLMKEFNTDTRVHTLTLLKIVKVRKYKTNVTFKVEGE